MSRNPFEKKQTGAVFPKFLQQRPGFEEGADKDERKKFVSSQGEAAVGDVSYHSTQANRNNYLVTSDYERKRDTFGDADTVALTQQLQARYAKMRHGVEDERIDPDARRPDETEEAYVDRMLESESEHWLSSPETEYVTTVRATAGEMLGMQDMKAMLRGAGDKLARARPKFG
ncbi:hypothetical protein J8273_2136 [Carpediemonas membranifera]|uniref:Uncharacterized protein n=1 Tax=Carpediemonas membranifera TaxID=201153 RepID=A0A8J6B1F9_9EUKA|nr:hypothetical protein J8273_2136 [Carpediemonas membranifera]|eukprot:KAG9396405.1 hypothetical protein J8273_2136 [Carpediemonas membranifera]